MDNTNTAPTAAELNRLKKFLLWAKENEIQLHDVTFGDINITMTDLDLIEGQEEVKQYDGKVTAPEPKSMYDHLARARGIMPNG